MQEYTYIGQENDYKYYIQEESQTIMITEYLGKSHRGTHVIPDRINGLKVVGFDGLNLFYNCLFDEVVFSKYQESFGSWSFNGAHNLKRVYFSESISEINGDNIFVNCPNKIEFSLPEGIEKLSETVFNISTTEILNKEIVYNLKNFNGFVIDILGIEDLVLPRDFGLLPKITDFNNHYTSYSVAYSKRLNTVLINEVLKDSKDIGFYRCDQLHTINVVTPNIKICESGLAYNESLKMINLESFDNLSEYCFQDLNTSQEHIGESPLINYINPKISFRKNGYILEDKLTNKEQTKIMIDLIDGNCSNILNNLYEVGFFDAYSSTNKILINYIKKLIYDGRFDSLEMLIDIGLFPFKQHIIDDLINYANDVKSVNTKRVLENLLNKDDLVENSDMRSLKKYIITFKNMERVEFPDIFDEQFLNIYRNLIDKIYDLDLLDINVFPYKIIGVETNRSKSNIYKFINMNVDNRNYKTFVLDLKVIEKYYSQNEFSSKLRVEWDLKDYVIEYLDEFLETDVTTKKIYLDNILSGKDIVIVSVCEKSTNNKLYNDSDYILSYEITSEFKNIILNDNIDVMKYIAKHVYREEYLSSFKYMAKEHISLVVETGNLEMLIYLILQNYEKFLTRSDILVCIQKSKEVLNVSFELDNVKIFNILSKLWDRLLQIDREGVN